MEIREVQVLKMLMIQPMSGVDDNSLNEELETFKHFLVDSEMYGE